MDLYKILTRALVLAFCLPVLGCDDAGSVEGFDETNIGVDETARSLVFQGPERDPYAVDVDGTEPDRPADDTEATGTVEDKPTPPEESEGLGRDDSTSGDPQDVEPEAEPGEESPDQTSPPDENTNTTGGQCVIADPSSLPLCCSTGSARCTPPEMVAPVLQTFLGSCDNGGYCVPDNLFGQTGQVTPFACTSISDAVGACMSPCVPEVAPYASLLPQDVCATGAVCVPCINPLDGEDTGVCDSFVCEWPDAGAPEPTPSPEPDAEPEEPEEPEQSLMSCDDPPTEPVVDMDIFEPCCDGAHCVPSDFVPADMASELLACDSNSLCVPDVFIETAGYFTPPTCELPGDVEGRCLSSCLPVVIEQLDLLPQSSCGSAERCVPCCDPFSGEPTGACDVGCDTGPEGGVCEVAYDTCCGGDGHCIPAELIPDNFLENLNGDGCTGSSLCVPDMLQDTTYSPDSCSGSILFQLEYSGVCLPKCLDIPLDILIWSGTCSSTEDCVPCEDPLTGESTGAPGC
jgi:hypothetical protein